MFDLEVISLSNRPGVGGVFYGDYAYRVLDGTEFPFFGVDVAWCCGCDDFVLAERLETIDSIQSEIEKLNSVRTKWATLDAEMLNHWAENGISLPSDSFKNWHQTRYDIRKATLAWRKSRKSPPKCLTCGSVFGIRILPLHEDIEHPLGRGIIRIQGRGVLGGRPPQVTFFDGEGKRLDSLTK